MTEPISATAGGGVALVKFFGGSAAASSAAITLGFLFMWPKTLHEAFVRILCTLIVSTFFGPVFVIGLHAWWPTLFDSAQKVAVEFGADEALGLLFVAGPVMAMCGLPAWWVVGGLVRWLDKRKEKDFGELVADARAVFDASQGVKKEGGNG